MSKQSPNFLNKPEVLKSGNTPMMAHIGEILVVENDPKISQKIDQLLGSSFIVRHATTGFAAVKMIQSQSRFFDLLITEITLPDFSGIELIKKSRRIDSELICMVLTNSENEDDFFSAVRAGAHGYLIKNDIEYSLNRSIDSILSHHYPVSLPFSKYLFRSAGSPIISNFTNHPNISPRELQLLKFIANGHTYSECAKLMKISLSTIQTHIKNMYRKLKITNQRQAIKIAHDSGLLNQ